jgi:hypothetical protein
MPLDPKAITPRDVRASGVLAFVEDDMATAAGAKESPAGAERVKEVSAIKAERERDQKAKVEKARRKREEKQRGWCASSPTRGARAGAATDRADS